MNRMLCALFFEVEIHDASNQLDSLKALSLDGFPSIFNHKFWSTLVERATTKFYEGYDYMREINRTHIALIPKVQSLECTRQFRPISLCNNSYKILSKILANCLKGILPHIISKQQNAFIAGRQIQDNIIIAHDVYHNLMLKKEGKKFEVA